MSSGVFIAMFPLQLVIFPGEVIPLHIFEERYKQLIGECESEGARFIIPTYLNQNVAEVATEVSLVKIMRRTAEGEMDILVRGERVVEILDVYETLDDKLYPGARVVYRDHDPTVDDATADKLRNLVLELARLLDRTSPISEPTHGSLAFSLAPYLELPMPQKLRLLGMNKEQERQEFLITHVEKLVKAVRDRKSKESQVHGFNHNNGRSNGRARLKS